MSLIKFILIFIVVLIPAFYYVIILKGEPKLIPLKVLLGNPNKVIVRMSPDGKFISYLAPHNEILNIFIKSIDKDDVKVITNDTTRGIKDYFWSFDGKKILYIRDNKGDENWHLFKVDLDTLQEIDLTPYEGVQARLIEYEYMYPNKIIIELNKRDKKVFDAYELDLDNESLKLLEQNPGNIKHWAADKDLNIKLALESLDDGGTKLLIKSDNKWKDLITWSFEDGSPKDVQISQDNKFVYLIDSKNLNTLSFRKFNIETKKFEMIVTDPNYDVSSVMFDIKTRIPIAVNIYKDKSTWKVLDNDYQQDFINVSKLDSGDFNISRAKDEQDRYWIVAYTKDNAPVSYWFYDRATKKGKFLYYSRSELLNYQLASMHPMKYEARDGVTIHGYITYPPKNKNKDLPMVLVVHGGPWTRDKWGFDPEAQWLANRGYVALQVNYRGSTGYGKKFQDLGNKQWGLNMQNDLTDAVNWAIKQKIADPKKVAIYGGSYGGYAALAGAAFTPNLYCCAVDIVGVSNIVTLIKSIPPYWSTYLAELYKRVGNPETEPEFLKSISPLFSANKIKIPVLIAQGANDPRVKQAESDQIVAALQKHGIEHKYLLFPDEGHGFYKASNRLKFYLEADKFLSKYLGGRHE